MRPAELFGVLVRTIGFLICVSFGMSIGFGVIIAVLGSEASMGYLIMGAPGFIAGGCLMTNASSIVSFAYPNEPRDQL